MQSLNTIELPKVDKVRAPTPRTTSSEPDVLGINAPLDDNPSGYSSDDSMSDADADADSDYDPTTTSLFARAVPQTNNSPLNQDAGTARQSEPSGTSGNCAGADGQRSSPAPCTPTLHVDTAFAPAGWSSGGRDAEDLSPAWPRHASEHSPGPIVSPVITRRRLSGAMPEFLQARDAQDDENGSNARSITDPMDWEGEVSHGYGYIEFRRGSQDYIPGSAPATPGVDGVQRLLEEFPEYAHSRYDGDDTMGAHDDNEEAGDDNQLAPPAGGRRDSIEVADDGAAQPDGDVDGNGQTTDTGTDTDMDAESDSDVAPTSARRTVRRPKKRRAKSVDRFDRHAHALLQEFRRFQEWSTCSLGDYVDARLSVKTNGDAQLDCDKVLWATSAAARKDWAARVSGATQEELMQIVNARRLEVLTLGGSEWPIVTIYKLRQGLLEMDDSRATVHDMAERAEIKRLREKTIAWSDREDLPAASFQAGSESAIPASGARESHPVFLARSAGTSTRAEAPLRGANATAAQLRRRAAGSQPRPRPSQTHDVHSTAAHPSNSIVAPSAFGTTWRGSAHGPTCTSACPFDAARICALPASELAKLDPALVIDSWLSFNTNIRAGESALGLRKGFQSTPSGAAYADQIRAYVGAGASAYATERDMEAAINRRWDELKIISVQPEIGKAGLKGKPAAIIAYLHACPAEGVQSACELGVE